ncbi:MAG: hypothetical protein RIR00_2386 [Pseudomonadota bacterium]|jgi:protein TonB
MNPLLDRRFMIMVLLSLLLHSLLLALINPPWRKAMAELPPLIATLRLVVPGSTATQSRPASAPLPIAAPPRSAPPRPQAPPPEARPSATPTLPRLTAEASSAGPTIPAAAAASAPAAASSAASPAPQATSPTAAAPAAASSRSAADAAEALAAYRRRLGELFAGQQDYPRLAALRGWEGEVRLRLKVARKGTLLDISLDRSSGFELLDRSAQALVEALPALPPLPDSIDLNEIQVVVPIHYKLRKTT